MRGCLILVVGPSGAGKDSLLAHAKIRLACNPEFRFVRRCITRPARAGNEDHLAVSESDFVRRLAADGFALHWNSHGLRYGIDREIDDWLGAGCTVVANGSRAHLPVARERYPTLRVISVVASPATLARRLAQRRRESADDIAARIARQPTLPQGLPLIEVDNDGSLEASAETFLRALDTHRQSASMEAQR